jgi:hypothetical protein
MRVRWLALLLVAGCAAPIVPRQTYEGARRPRAEVAVVEGEDHMTFVELDERSLGVAPADEGSDRAHRIEVLPGAHVLRVDWKRRGDAFTNIDGSLAINFGKRFAFPVRLEFQAMAGHAYRVKGLIHKRVDSSARSTVVMVRPEADVLLVDVATGETLARDTTMLRDYSVD